MVGHDSRSCIRHMVACERLFYTVRTLGPVTLVSAPQIDIAEAQGVPPGIKHGAIEAQDTVASHACRRRSKRCKAVVNARAIRIVHAREQMPKCESVLLARIRKEDPEQGVAL